MLWLLRSLTSTTICTVFVRFEWHRSLRWGPIGDLQGVERTLKICQKVDDGNRVFSDKLQILHLDSDLLAHFSHYRCNAASISLPLFNETIKSIVNGCPEPFIRWYQNSKAILGIISLMRRICQRSVITAVPMAPALLVASAILKTADSRLILSHKRTVRLWLRFLIVAYNRRKIHRSFLVYLLRRLFILRICLMIVDLLTRAFWYWSISAFSRKRFQHYFSLIWLLAP